MSNRTGEDLGSLFRETLNHGRNLLVDVQNNTTGNHLQDPADTVYSFIRSGSTDEVTTYGLKLMDRPGHKIRKRPDRLSSAAIKAWIGLDGKEGQPQTHGISLRQIPESDKTAVIIEVMEKGSNYTIAASDQNHQELSRRLCLAILSLESKDFVSAPYFEMTGEEIEKAYRIIDIYFDHIQKSQLPDHKPGDSLSAYYKLPGDVLAQLGSSPKAKNSNTIQNETEHTFKVSRGQVNVTLIAKQGPRGKRSVICTLNTNQMPMPLKLVKDDLNIVIELLRQVAQNPGDGFVSMDEALDNPLLLTSATHSPVDTSKIAELLGRYSEKGEPADNDY